MRAILLGLILPLIGAAPLDPARHWVTGWASAQQLSNDADALPANPHVTTTLRQIVRVTRDGAYVRVRVSNVLGATPLALTGAHVALAERPGSAAIRSGSGRRLSFAGARGLIVPAGAEWWSDPVAVTVRAGDNLAISLALKMPVTGQTIHSASHATSFMLSGDHLAAPDLPQAARVVRWAFLSGVDVGSDIPGNSVIAFGDSITDGSWSTTDGNDRWPDILADRLRMQGRQGGAVLNLGIGGNRILTDGKGPNALARFDRDVLGQAGVRHVIILAGINDLGMLTRDAPALPAEHDALVARITAAYRQLVARCHARGLKVYGGTLLPFGGSKTYHPDAANEADRIAVNDWIRGAGVFDAVIDFDRMLRDPANPERLLPAYDSGDHLHPSPTGYRRMAAGVPLNLFKDAGRKREDAARSRSGDRPE
jgi:lysophospholipase L1-like esterase